MAAARTTKARLLERSTTEWTAISRSRLRSSTCLTMTRSWPTSEPSSAARRTLSLSATCCTGARSGRSKTTVPLVAWGPLRSSATLPSKTRSSRWRSPIESMTRGAVRGRPMCRTTSKPTATQRTRPDAPMWRIYTAGDFAAARHSPSCAILCFRVYARTGLRKPCAGS